MREMPEDGQVVCIVAALVLPKLVDHRDESDRDAFLVRRSFDIGDEFLRQMKARLA